MLKILSCVLMAVMILSGCTTTPLTPLMRMRPISLLVPSESYLVAKDVSDIPGVTVENFKRAGLCRARLLSLQKWVNEDYK